MAFHNGKLHIFKKIFCKNKEISKKLSAEDAARRAIILDKLFRVPTITRCPLDIIHAFTRGSCLFGIGIREGKESHCISFSHDKENWISTSFLRLEKWGRDNFNKRQGWLYFGQNGGKTAEKLLYTLQQQTYNPCRDCLLSLSLLATDSSHQLSSSPKKIPINSIEKQ